jgi:hypothetical protein
MFDISPLEKKSSNLKNVYSNLHNILLHTMITLYSYQEGDHLIRGIQWDLSIILEMSEFILSHHIYHIIKHNKK